MMEEPRDGQLLANLMHFARVLRAAGLPIGPGKVVAAAQAVLKVGIWDRADFYWTLHAVFVNRPQQREIFDQAFHVFWRNPRLLEQMMSLVLPSFRDPGLVAEKTLSRRLADALHPAAGNRPHPPRRKPPELEIDATMTWSAREILQNKDFEQMSETEIAQAKAAVSAMRLPLWSVPSRRLRSGARGSRIDPRGSFRMALKTAGEPVELRRLERRHRVPPLVVICDISGSMSRYSRMLLHFAHTLTGVRDRVHSFVFGTRLTNVSRHLREKDVDLALERVATWVQDWSGGTRIGQCLHEFNRDWSRRVLGQGAVVLLITDGLDRDTGQGLGEEMDRLHKSARRLIWLNPLLRYEDFEPRSLGMRAMLPHVDEFRTAHNIASLQELIRILSSPVMVAGPAGAGDSRKELRQWRSRIA